MDEAHNLGLGKYLDKNGYSSRFEIMSKHLKRVLEIAEKYGYSCTMWSDMFFRLLNKGAYKPADGEIIARTFGLDSAKRYAYLLGLL